MTHLEVSRETLIDLYFPTKKDEIIAFAAFLKGAGIERGLIGPREGEKIWERHIFNSLPVISLIPQGSSVIDIGSGAGLPGIPIALARPDLRLTLIEPLQRRVDFLNEAVSGLDIAVLRGRAQDFKVKADFVTARAVAPLAKLKEISWHLVKKGGALLAIKGQSALDEVSTVANAELFTIELTGLPLGRIISLQKTG